MNDRDVCDRLTVEEKAALVAGTNFMETVSVPRLSIPSVRTSDGPHGLRVQTEGGDNGVTGSLPATAFPTAAALASGWNTENAYKIGRALAEECLHYGVNVLLGPAVNIKRNPLCGRNFEYFSEDPLLAGKLAAAQVKGIQSAGVGAAVKHFALNNAENFRFTGDSVCDERALREIYLKPFEIIVKESKPYAVMCAYNRVNGTFCSENRRLLTEILREEWGFDGLVMTDWGASHDRLKMLRAGCDLEMPGDTAICRKQISEGIGSGELAQEDLDRAVKNVLGLAERCAGQTRAEADFGAHDELAAEVAADCAVLLKNDGLLPLEKGGAYFVAGELFEKPRYQGAGSSMIYPARLVSPRAAFDNRKLAYGYAKAYRADKVESDEALIAQAVRAAEGYEVVLFFAGLPDCAESEGADRENMRLPENQLRAIDALLNAGKRLAVVLMCGSPVELPFADRVSAILNLHTAGQGCGTAAAELLFGGRNPNGRLAESWAEVYSDIPFGAEYSRSAAEVYRESVFVGYRYFLTAGKRARYPFGYGLSYTSFEYSDFSAEEKEETIVVSCTVKNTGARAGAEIVQLYVKAPQTEIFKPEKELRAFCKVYLNAGESKRAETSFEKKELRYWNAAESRYVTERGEYELQICSDCETVKLSQKLFLAGEKAPSPYGEAVRQAYGGANTERMTDGAFEEMSRLKIPQPAPQMPICLESRFSDLKRTFWGRILYRAVMSMPKRKMRRAKRLPKGEARDNAVKGAVFLKRVLESGSLISMSMSAGKRFPHHYAQGFAHFANGKIFKAIACFCKRMK